MLLQNEIPAWRADTEEAVGMITAISPCPNLPVQLNKILLSNPKPISASHSGGMVRGVTAVSENRNRQIELILSKAKFGEVHQIKTRTWMR